MRQCKCSWVSRKVSWLCAICLLDTGFIYFCAPASLRVLSVCMWSHLVCQGFPGGTSGKDAEINRSQYDLRSTMLKEVQEPVDVARDEDRQISWQPSDYQGPGRC